MRMGRLTMALRRASTATMTMLRMPARRMGIMGRAGLAAASLSEPDRGSAAVMATVEDTAISVVPDLGMGRVRAMECEAA